MQLSERVRHMSGADAGAWIPYYRAREMIEAGETVTDLTIGDHDISTSSDILEQMHRSAMGGKTGYTVIPGIRSLRDAVAERIQSRTGVPTTYQNVVITSGGQGALIAAHLALLDAGDRAVYGEPYYPTYPGTISAAGGTPVALPMRPENGFRPHADDLDRVAEGTKTILFNSPNNPTGAVYPLSTLKDIARTAAKHRLWVISDEVYDTQLWQGEHISIRSLPDMAERTFVIGSMSKGYAMTGSRVGWLAGPAARISALEELLTVVNFGIPEFIQEAALYALNQGSALERRIAEPYRLRRQAALDVLAGRNAVRLLPPDGAMYLMLDIRSTGLSGTDFSTRLLDREQIAVMPGESFGRSAAGHIRIAMTTGETSLADALDRIAGFAEALAAQKNERD
ncbi:MAG: pyridoxal phosphate-dependent aminotransferase [Rhodobacteraceae bacterium]|nr:pyridoxal phosphate-dependent aminotransferase [Paracoccaceae bacterium]